MKKTKYNKGGLTGRGNNQEGLDLRYDSPNVSASRNTNQDSKSITVRNKDKNGLGLGGGAFFSTYSEGGGFFSTYSEGGGGANFF